ncbi:carnitine acetyltransferase [Infundibulicybe gibba]|nr:carnitine acetyltransferase [Infundibulicybe gibba]
MFGKRFHSFSNQIRLNSTMTRKTPLALPRLPVPDLHQTLSRYLASLEPLLLQDEARGGAPYQSAYDLRVKWAGEFASGVGQVCQERLQALDRASPNNWLNDNFWINKAYLEWRAPLIVNSNWWLAFHDDNQIPESALVGETSNSRAGITFWQVRRAAWLVHRTLQFKSRLDTQEIHPETTRTGIWLRDSTSKMFNIARIPKQHCDILSTPPSPSSPSSHKLLLMIHNWFYTVTVTRPTSDPARPELIPVREIETQIHGVVLDVERRLADGERAVPIGILSADQRDLWAANLEHLLSLSVINQKTHEVISHSLMGLSLEHTTYSCAPSVLPGPPSSFSDPPQSILDAHLHTIRSTPLNASNRFFDKPYTVIVDPSARAGATGEHSSCDALVPSIVAEFGIVEGIDSQVFGTSDEVFSDDKPTSGWERLDWVVDDKVKRQCLEATGRANAIMEDSDDSVLWFRGYGTDWMKGIAQLAPDAYIQMALQLAWYKTRGEFTATYETVLTRMFKHGRTETLRTLTRDSMRWVLSMVDPHSSTHTRHLYLRRAIQTHSQLTREAATGKGIDRHLLGLRLLLRPLNGERAALFEDDLFERSSQWKLSTSGLSAGHLFRGTGYVSLLHSYHNSQAICRFGAGYEDGYGINYLAAPEMIKFGIESKFASPLTSTTKFKVAIVEALDEMKEVCFSEEDVMPKNHFPSNL